VQAQTMEYILANLDELTVDTPLFLPVLPNDDNTQDILTCRFIVSTGSLYTFVIEFRRIYPEAGMGMFISYNNASPGSEYLSTITKLATSSFHGGSLS
jgi:hypothetical protein